MDRSFAEGYGPLTHAELARFDESDRSEMVRIGDDFYHAGVFIINGQASAAKAVVFAGEAQIALSEGHRIWAAISAYYSLFHLATTIVFLLPQRVPEKLLERLLRKRAGGREDPSELIGHKTLAEYLTLYERAGLPCGVREALVSAKVLREFVNYAPRIVWREDKIVFRSLEHSTAELPPLVASLSDLILTTLVWVRSQGRMPEGLVGIVLSSLPDFLTKSDLMYSQWCAEPTLELAQRLASGLTSGCKRQPLQ